MTEAQGTELPGLMAILLLGSLSVVTFASEQLYNFDIPEQSASAALNEFAQQAEQQVLFPLNRVKSITTNSLKGEYTVTEAIGILLDETGLRPVFGNFGVITIERDHDANVADGVGEMKIERKHSLLSKAALLIFGAVTAQGVAAQDQASGSQAGVLEEIVVTAQKREENIQDISIAITAFSGDMVETLGFTRPVDVITQVPNMNFQGPFGDVGLPFLNIRGVQLYDFGDANESSVATYLDDVYIGTAAAVTGQIFDVERIEVLRGPQGTLYGRNTTGGVMHFISRQPTDEFEARASFQYGSFDQKIADVSVSGPFSDSMRGRIAARYNKDDGWQDNPTLGDSYALTDAFSIRGILDVDITKDLTASINIHYTDSNGKNQQQGFRGANDPVTGARCSLQRIKRHECGNLAGFVDPDPDPREIFTDETELTNEVEVLGGYLRLNWNLDWAELVSITAYSEVDKFVREDPDAAPYQLFNFVEAYSADTEQITQEIRLSGNQDRYSWLIGGFFYDDKKFVTSAFEKLFGGTGSYATTEATSWALFGQVNFELIDTVTAVMGIRYTEEDRDLVNLTSLRAPVVGTRMGNPVFSVSDSVSAEKTTGKIGLEWRPIDDLMMYGSVSTGFKSPVYNTTTISDINRIGPVGEEELTNFEIGMKSTLWSGRARLNMTGFYYDYKGIQIVGNAPDATGAPVSVFLNIGDADIYGLETELSLAPTDFLDMQIGLGLIDHEISADPSILVTGMSVDGNKLSNTPGVNLNGLIRYRLPEIAAGNTVLQADFRWQDNVFFGPDNQNLESQESYGILNLRASWESPNGRFKISGFVDNVFDKEYVNHVFADPGLWVGHLLWGRPRWFGGQIDLSL